MRRPMKPTFSARGDRCPICKRDFRRDDCPHSVAQAESRIEADYLHAVVRYELAKAAKNSSEAKP